MESDRKIVTEIPVIISDTFKSVGLETLGLGFESWVYLLTCVLLCSVLGYITFRIFKRVYVKKKVAQLHYENNASLDVSSARLHAKLIAFPENEERLAEIARLPWGELTSKFKTGKLSAITVLAAYQTAALDVHNKTNSVVAWLEEAEAQATQLDSVPAGERGPLHGIPISVKECYDVKGSYSTAGMSIFARNLASRDCPLVEMVKKLGGVPFCKTNVPQVMYSLQCSNPIYGTTTNPHGENRECGGSSGGEGALVGGGGSILGLGSDVGGSLRNPPAFCGCFSLKPTAGRHLSQLGVVAGVGAPAVGIDVVGGFIGRSAAAVEEAWRMVWGVERDHNTQVIDTGIVPPMWDQVCYDRKPKIGFYTTDEMIDPAPGCVRAVTQAVDMLSKAGYEVVPISPPDIHQVMYYFNGILLADLNKELYKNMSYDVYDSTLTGVVAAISVYKLPWIVKKLLVNPILSLLTRIPPITSVFSTTAKLCQGISDRDQLTRSYLAQMDSKGVDIILCPAQLLPAPPTGVMGNFVAGVSPYIPWNVMNFPAGIAPVTKWSADDDSAMADYPTDDLAYKMVRNYCQKARGLPLAVQVVGRPFMDEQVLRILSELEKVG